MMMEEKSIEEKRSELEKLLGKWNNKRYSIVLIKNFFDKWIEEGDYEEILRNEEEEALKKREYEIVENKRKSRKRLMQRVVIVFSSILILLIVLFQIENYIKSKTRFTFIRVNDNGYKEYRNKKDGSILIYIPAGEFTMGSERGYDNEKPVHKVYLDGYYISKYEVTNKQFVRFLNSIKDSLSFKDTIANGYECRAAKKGKDYIFEIYWDGYTKTESLKNWVIPIIYENGTYKCISGYENHPVVNVTWYGSKAYCKWAGLRLPTEAEWEKASRGTDGREYPWGNGEPGTNRCNYDPGNYTADGYKYTSPIGSYENGRSPYGCYDMAGNVWEWCNDWYGGSYYRDSEYRNPKGPNSGEDRVVRGGSWYDYANYIRSANRDNITPSGMNYYFGFRPAI